MRRLSMVLLVSLLMAGTASGETLAVVNGHKITSTDIAVADPAALGNPAAERQALEALISRELLAQHAQQNGKIDEEKLGAALSIYKTQILANNEAQDFLKNHPITEQAIQNAYRSLMKNYHDKEIRFRTIVVPDQSQANVIIQKLRQGKSFSMLAAQYSVAQNAALGGEMGWTPESKLDAAYSTILEHSADGTITGPISVPQGWAIIQKLGEREAVKPSLEQLRAQIEAELRNKELADYVATLRKKARVELVGIKKNG